jgi:hypothetical protein
LRESFLILLTGYWSCKIYEPSARISGRYWSTVSFYNREFFLAYNLLISPIFMFSSEIIVWSLFYATDFECSYCHWQRGLSGDKKLHVFWLSFSCYVCKSSADRNNLQRVYWYVSALASMNIICLQQLLH